MNRLCAARGVSGTPRARTISYTSRPVASAEVSTSCSPPRSSCVRWWSTTAFGTRRDCMNGAKSPSCPQVPVSSTTTPPASRKRSAVAGVNCSMSVPVGSRKWYRGGSLLAITTRLRLPRAVRASCRASCDPRPSASGRM